MASQKLAKSCRPAGGGRPVGGVHVERRRSRVQPIQAIPRLLGLVMGVAGDAVGGERAVWKVCKVGDSLGDACSGGNPTEMPFTGDNEVIYSAGRAPVSSSPPKEGTFHVQISAQCCVGSRLQWQAHGIYGARSGARGAARHRANVRWAGCSVCR